MTGLIVDHRTKNLANMLRNAGQVLLGEGYESLSEQIDALLVNYDFQGLSCETCGDVHDGEVPRECETGDGV